MNFHPNPGMTIDASRTALVLTDMHNDFLSPSGAAYGLIAKSLSENNTVDNLERLLKAAKDAGLKVFMSPHYYYPHDDQWIVPLGALEQLAHDIGLVRRKDPLSVEDLNGSGADVPERFKPYIHDGRTVVTSPHKAYGTSTNDMIMQLHRTRIEKIILAGPVGNLCVEAHMRDFIEHGFEVAMISDATAGAQNEYGDGYTAALINWRFMANALWTTEEAVAQIRRVTAIRMSA